MGMIQVGYENSAESSFIVGFSFLKKLHYISGYCFCFISFGNDLEETDWLTSGRGAGEVARQLSSSFLQTQAWFPLHHEGSHPPGTPVPGDSMPCPGFV